MRQQKKKRARPLVPAILMLVAAVLFTGCGIRNNADSAKSGVKSQNYSDDGYLGMTNSYPHVPGRHMALNYSNDARMMRDAIRGIRGITGANITFHGAEAYVSLKLQPGLATHEIPTVERQAASVLRFNFPRYTVNVHSVR